MSTDYSVLIRYFSWSWYSKLQYCNFTFHTTDYQKKIDLCKQKTEAAKAEVASDAEIHLLQKELDEELQRETLLQEELR